MSHPASVSTSWWMRHAPALRGAPLPPARRCDVLVVGAGLAGATTAWHLAQYGIDVVLLDPRPAGHGASGRSAGFLLLCNAAEYPTLRTRLGMEGARTWLAMTRANAAWIHTHFAESARLEARGSFMLAGRGSSEQTDTLVEACALLNEDGVACALEPTPAALADFAPQALRIHEDAGMDPARLTAAIAAEVPRFVSGSVDALHVDQGHATVGDARVTFERVVIASNAWTGALLGEAHGGSAHITPERAQCLVTEPLRERLLPEVVYANEGYDYFRQTPDRRLILGGRRHLHVDEEHTSAEGPTAGVQASLDAYIAQHLPFARGARVESRWAGTMGFTNDQLPYLGALPNSGGRGSVVAGFSGHGMSLAAACGATLARVLVGTPTELDQRAMALFAPDRA